LKKRGIFQIFGQKFIFEFSSYYDWNSSKDTKKEEKRRRLPHYLIESHKNANENYDLRQMR